MRKGINAMEEKLSIIIFKGDKALCYGVLQSFSEQLRDAFLEIGEDVIYLDPDVDFIEDYIGRRYKAIIAFMENFFYSVTPDGKMVFDQFEGPKFNYWTDYPAFYYKHVKAVPKNYFILTQDRNYVKFINHYYRNVKAFFLPPGGRKATRTIPFNERSYSLSFVGTYLPWEDAIEGFNLNDETTKVIVDKYLDYLISNPNETTETAFSDVLRKLGAEVNDDQFVRELARVHRLADRGAARLYRQEIIGVLLENGIVIDVFGDSWKKAPFSDDKNLRIHPAIDSDRVNEIYEESKMSLNIMTWHKDSITERVLDAMMAGCITVSDQTPVLRECFEDGKEILLYSLKEIKRLPDIIRHHENDEGVAIAGMQRASAQHSWRDRAEQLLSLIEEMGV